MRSLLVKAQREVLKAEVKSLLTLSTQSQSEQLFLSGTSSSSTEGSQGGAPTQGGSLALPPAPMMLPPARIVTGTCLLVAGELFVAVR